MKNVLPNLERRCSSNLLVKGSSVGIYKVSNKEESDKAIQDGFHYDFKILVEETIANPREVECSVSGNRDIKASKLGAIRVPAEDAFYDYNNKFVDASGVVFEIPVELPENLTKEIQQMSLDAFRVLGNRGLARRRLPRCMKMTCLISVKSILCQDLRIFRFIRNCGPFPASTTKICSTV